MSLVTFTSFHGGLSLKSSHGIRQECCSLWVHAVWGCCCRCRCSYKKLAVFFGDYAALTRYWLFGDDGLFVSMVTASFSPSSPLLLLLLLLLSVSICNANIYLIIWFSGSRSYSKQSGGKTAIQSI